MRLLLAFLLGLASVMQLSGQALSGVVADSVGEPIVFATISNGNEVVFSDLDGRFAFENGRLSDSIWVRAMGYRPMAGVLEAMGDTLWLQLDGVQIEDVVILPGVNPAMRLIKGAAANRKQNRPEALDAFSYTGYNKLKFDAGKELGDPAQNGGRKWGFSELMIVETVVETHFRQPDRYKSEVLASRISAYPGQALPLSAQDLQSVSFYDDQIAVLGSRFASPIAPGGISKYIYILEDTVLRAKDSLFLIRFLPKEGAFNGLEGVISLQSGTWAVTHVDAQLALREPDLLLTGGSIQQLYTELPNGHWFPRQLDADLETKPMSKSVKNKWLLSSRSYIQDIRLEKADVVWNTESVVMADDAGEKNALLDSGRVVPLTLQEQRAYHFLDSLGVEAGLPQIMGQLDHLALGRLQMGPVDLELDRLVGGNIVEGSRFGLGLVTNEKISERWSLEGWAGYGIRDKAWKYGGAAVLRPLKTERWVMGASYAKDLWENGHIRVGNQWQMAMWGNPYRTLNAGSFYQPFVNRGKQWMAWNYIELPGNLGLRLEATQEESTPDFDYAFSGDSTFRFREAAAWLRWAPGEEYTRQGWLRFAHANDLPVVWLRVSKGLQDGFGEYDWWQAEASISHFIKMAGRTGLRLRLNAGKVFQPVPLARSHVFSGIYSPKNWFDVSYVFNTMRFQEFAANEYAEAFVRYQPYLPGLGIGQWRPKLTLVASAAWGRWGSDGGAGHERLAIAAPESVFAEAGIFVQNILPSPKNDNINFSILRLIGVGVYRRIGPYAFDDERQNWAIRLTMAAF